MNKQRRKRLEEASALLEQAKEILEEVKDEEAEAYENLPEGLQGSERGEAMQEAIDNLESGKRLRRPGRRDMQRRRGGGVGMMNMDIYGAGLCFPEFEKQFEAIEAALGFKLFAWQKTYIAHGQFRRYGATTAEVLRELMQVEAFPLDYTKRPTTQREAWYRGFLREIKQQLDDAGVPTREVFFNQQQKRAYMENPENRRKERERYPEAMREVPARLWR